MEHRGEADEKGTLQDAQEEEWADWAGGCQVYCVCVTANVTLITSAKSQNGSKHLKCVYSPLNYTIHS